MTPPKKIGALFTALSFALPLTTPFSAQAERYLGLISNESHDVHTNAGLASIQVSRAQSFTARVSWQGASYSLSGQFREGKFETTVHNKGAGKETLRIIMTRSDRKIIGAVFDYRIESTFIAEPTRSAANPTTLPPVYHARMYSAFQPSPILDTTGNITCISANGAVLMSGWLGDGSRYITRSWLVPTSRVYDGYTYEFDAIPIYMKLPQPRKRGYLWGTATLSPRSLGNINLLKWSRPVSQEPGALMERFLLHLGGSPYKISPENPWMITPEVGDPGRPQAQMFIRRPGMNYTIIPLKIAADNTIEVAGPNPYQVRFETDPERGSFRGSLLVPDSGQQATFKGIAVTRELGSAFFRDSLGLGEIFIWGDD